MSDMSLNRLVEFVKDHYGTNEFIPLHAPVFSGREKAYVADTIESTFVSSVGAYGRDTLAPAQQWRRSMAQQHSMSA